MATGVRSSWDAAATKRRSVAKAARTGTSARRVTSHVTSAAPASPTSDSTPMVHTSWDSCCSWSVSRKPAWTNVGPPAPSSSPLMGPGTVSTRMWTPPNVSSRWSRPEAFARSSAARSGSPLSDTPDGLATTAPRGSRYSTKVSAGPTGCSDSPASLPGLVAAAAAAASARSTLASISRVATRAVAAPTPRSSADTSSNVNAASRRWVRPTSVSMRSPRAAARRPRCALTG